MKAGARAAALVAAALAGCAATPAPEEPRKYRPLESYASDPFVPVNLYMNANEHATGQHARLIEYAAQRLHDSGAFVRVDRGVQRWPITIQARYRLDESSAGDIATRVLGLLTLGLVPVHVSQTHVLFAEIFAEPDDVAALEVTATVRDRISIYDLGRSDRTEKAAVDALLDRLAAELAQRKLIPRWKTFKTEPKKKPKPEGRPT